MMCRWHADDMCVCRWCADDTRHSTAWNWATQGSVRMTCRWHVCADDMQMTCRQHVCLRMMCGWRADDTRCSTPWNWATQASVRMTCGRCPDDICHPPVKSHPKSHFRVICMSSACCPHVVRTRLQPQIYFHLNSRDSSANKPSELLQIWAKTHWSDLMQALT